MKELEIERKYLLRPCSPKRFLHAISLSYRRHSIMQYYLPPKEGEYVRYRKRDREFFKTIKRGEGLVREEYEDSVSKKEFESHLAGYAGNVIEKDRYVFTYEDVTYEMDRFHNTLDGLCYLEIEFEDEITARAFVLPDIFSSLYLAEVTEDKRFNNSSICKSATIPVLDSDLEVLVKKVTHLLSPEENSRKKDEGLSLEPFECSSVAIQAIFRDLSHRLEGERKRLLANAEDPEILHQFRIVIRKIKSVMKAFRIFFQPDWFALHQRNLSLLLAQTNANRDMDVLLEKIPFYRSLLPAKRQKSLASLEQLLLEKKEASGREMFSLGENELLRYEIASMMKPRMQQFFNEKMTTQPIVISAIQSVRKQTESIIKKGKKLDDHSGEKAYHKLRIQYKKLRYCIEAVRPLVKKEKYREVMKLIKEMQAILGEFHDYQVQRTLLSALGDNKALQNKKTKKAMNLLLEEIVKLEEKQEEKFRKKFVKMELYEKKLRRLFEVY